MTTERAVTDTDPDANSALRCYRHPEHETWVRCGRCDQPICTKCAMQGPVGFRCRQCGRPARDPLTSLRPTQLAIVLGVATAGGLITGLVAPRIGIFGLLLAWFAGGLIADAVIRFIGFKRGPRMAAMLFGGIVVGGLAAVWLGAAITVSGFGPDGMALIGQVVIAQAPWAALVEGIACFGAWSRLRF